METNLYNCHVDRIAPAHANPIEVAACPACGAELASPTFSVEGILADVVTCTECGLGRLYPLPDAEEIASFYPPTYYGSTGVKFDRLVESIVRIVAARSARFLSRGLPNGSRVLDIGCGRGVLLSALADRGYEVHGVEMSEQAAEGADPRAKIQIAPRLADADYPTGYFDQVILWHVMEHLPDPRGTLQEIHRILRPGGRVVIAVPNFSSWQSRWAGPAWFHLDLPRHLFHFPVKSLLRILKECGFQYQASHHFSLRQNPFGWVQSAQNRRESLPRNGLYRLLQSRGDGGKKPFDRMTRMRLRVVFLLGMPIGVLLSLLATWFRSGASVHVVATSQPQQNAGD